MYTLTENEAKELAAEIRRCKTREDGYAKIDEFAKKIGSYKSDIESCFTMDFPNASIFNALQWIS